MDDCVWRLVLHQTNNAGSAHPQAPRCKARPAGNIGHIAKGRNGAFSQECRWALVGAPFGWLRAVPVRRDRIFACLNFYGALVLHQTNNAVSVATGRFHARRVAQGIPRRISKRRNAARGLPVATRRARPQAPICCVATLGNMPDIPCGPRLASGRLWVR